MKYIIRRGAVVSVLAVVLWVVIRDLHAQLPIVTKDRATEFSAFKASDIIVFQGDSITDGGRQRSGSDFNHTMGQSYAYLIAADLGAKMPERNLTFINRGIDGSSVVDLSKRWKSDTIDLQPNFLSIYIGVNDTVFRKPEVESLDQFQQVYDKLISDTLTALPHAKIVLCEPFILPVGNTHNWPQFSDKAIFAAEMVEIRKHQEVVARLAAKYHLPEVMLQKAFDNACTQAPAEHWCWDGVHPTYAGHGLIAEEWKKVVQSSWPHE